MFHFSISSNTSNSKNINASNRNKMFSDYRSETFRLCRTDDKKYNFSSSKIFKVLMDCPDAQRETFPKSYNSSGNRKNLPTQFLSQRRYFMGNLKNIDRFLPSVKERRCEFICFRENWYSGTSMSMCVSFKMQLSSGATAPCITSWSVM